MTSERSRWLVPLAFLAFVSLGLPDGVVGVAWPSLRQSFDLPIDRLGVLLLAGMAGYWVSSFGSGAAVGRLGVGRLLFWSSLAVAASALVWSLSPWFWLVVGAAVVSGLGAGAIDTGVNTFAAAHFRPRIVTWLHASWGLGAMLGPVVMTAALTFGFGWRGGYAALAVALFAMSACFRLTLGLWDEPRTLASGLHSPPSPPGLSTMRESLAHPPVRANVALFFLYTGVETTAGQWAMSLFTESRGLSAGTAGTAVAGYWASVFVGRLVFGVLTHHVPATTLLRVSMGLAPLAALGVAVSTGAAAGSAALCALGFLLAPIFPLQIAETPARVGPSRAAHAIGFQVSAATLGAGALPAAAGLLAGRVGLEAIGSFLVGGTLAVLALHEWVLRRPWARSSRTAGP